MPKISLPVPEAYESVTRPVAMEIIRQVMDWTGIPTEGTPVFLQGVGELPIAEPGSSIHEKRRGAPRFPTTTKFTINIDEIYPEDGPVLQARLRPEHQLVFADHDLDVYLKPIYQIAEMRMSVTARFGDRVSAVKWRDDLRHRISAGRMEKLHEVDYHYPIPLEYNVILKHIHEMREAQAGYGEDLQTWLNNGFDARKEVITNQAGNHPTIVVREHQIGIIGWFDFGDMPPEPERVGTDSDSFTMDFDYIFRYEKPVAAAMLYPMMIHNQLVPVEFRDKKRPYRIEQRPTYKSLTRSMLDKFGDGYVEAYEGYPGMSLPFWDDWLPEYWPKGITNLMRVLIQVNPASPRELFSLKELGTHELDADAIAYLEDHPQGLTKWGECALHAILYKRYRPLSDSNLLVDSNLSLRASYDLPMRSYYHVWVGLLFDVDSLSKLARERLRRHGRFAQKYMVILWPDIEDAGMLPALLPDGSLNKKQFDDALFEIARQNYIERVHGEYLHRLVGAFVIDTNTRS